LAGRYQSVFDRAETMRLTFVGPQAPNGRQAEPWPAELPPDSKNVPTFHHSQATPATAERQLDYVFASHWIADKVIVRALNSVEEWVQAITVASRSRSTSEANFQRKPASSRKVVHRFAKVR